MYLIILEGSDNFYKVSELNDNDLKAADNGYMQIIDIRNPKNPKEYYLEDWVDIETCKL